MEQTTMNGIVKRAFHAAMALALACTFPTAVSAASYTMNAFSPTTVSDTYDWTDSQQIIWAEGSANATGSGLSGQFVFWDFSPATGSRYLTNGSYTIPYTIYKYPSNILGSELYAWSQSPSKDHVYSITLSGQQSGMTFDFAIVPAAGLLKPAGNYTGQITVGYYTGKLSGTTISNALQRTTASLGVTLTVPVIYDLSIMPSGSSSFDVNTYYQTLNFGTMTDGESLSANAIMRTNASSWSLAAASTNGGCMKNNATSATVPYTFSYNGTVKALSTNPTVIETGGWSATSSGYATRLLTFTLGDTFNTPGTYSDNLTLTLTAN
jgi:hypothetical protein